MGTPGASLARTSVTKKGLPPVMAMQLPGRTMGLSGKRGYSALREGEQAQPRDLAGRQIAQNETQGVVLAQFIVAPGQDEE